MGRTLQPADAHDLAEIRYEGSSEWCSPHLPTVSRRERCFRESRRFFPRVAEGLCLSRVEEAKNRKVAAFLDVEQDVQLHTPKPALMVFGMTKPEHRLQHHMLGLFDEICESPESSCVRTILPKLDDEHLQPARRLLRRLGFLERPWKQLARHYTPRTLGDLRDFFDCSEFPFRFGERGELWMRPAVPADLRELAQLRLSLALDLGYRTHFEAVEASVHRLIDRPSGAQYSPILFAVHEGNELVASVRVTPRYGIWEGLMRLEVRDVVIAESHRRQGLLKWVFTAAVVAGRSFIADVDQFDPISGRANPLLVETWVPDEAKEGAFRTALPSLVVTGRQYLENSERA